MSPAVIGHIDVTLYGLPVEYSWGTVLFMPQSEGSCLLIIYVSVRVRTLRTL